MKKNLVTSIAILSLLFVVALISTPATAQKPGYYKLKTPVVGYGDTSKYIYWYTIQYPVTNVVYWGLVKDTLTVRANFDGNTTIPQTVIDNWCADDSIIPAWLETQKVWLKKDD